MMCQRSFIYHSNTLVWDFDSERGCVYTAVGDIWEITVPSTFAVNLKQV